MRGLDFPVSVSRPLPRRAENLPAPLPPLYDHVAIEPFRVYYCKRRPGYYDVRPGTRARLVEDLGAGLARLDVAGLGLATVELDHFEAVRRDRENGA